jgi:(E)-4-hydroxy-3-methylbut-2-enyl-diphosphate synthase
VQRFVRARMPEWKQRYDGVETLSLAVMGCVVNGPGESRHADIGISLPGTGEAPVAPVFMDGKKQATLRGEGLTAEFLDMIEAYVGRRYPSRLPEPAGNLDPGPEPRGSQPD